MIYLKLFENHSEYEDFTGSTEYTEPNVSHCIEGNDVHYNIKHATAVTLNVDSLSISPGDTDTLIATVFPAASIDKSVSWSSDNDSVATVDDNGVVTAVAVGVANITVTTNDGSHTATCEVTVASTPMKIVANSPSEVAFDNDGLSYSYDNITWQALAANTPLSLSNGESIYLKGNMTPTSDPGGIGHFSASTGNFSVYGNALSLLYGDDYATATTVPDYAFYELFNGCTALTSVGYDLLPATTVGIFCYYYMFARCANLTNVPNLLAPVVNRFSYNSMFAYCYGLTSIPSDYLSNTTSIASDGCRYMFTYCSGLTSAMDVLPAMSIDNRAYDCMFRQCRALVTAPELPATTFVGTLATYSNMFSDCVSLRYIKCMLSSANDNQTDTWVANIPTGGVFVKNASATNWSTGINGIPEGWTVQDA